MGLPSPNLDDRDFTQLVDEARRRIARTCPGWTDLSPGDPGLALVEAFAHLTEVLIYRLNRLPEKAYVEFLRLLGVKLQAPCAAGALLRLAPAGPLTGPVEIPRGIRVTVARAGGTDAPPVFVTAKASALKPGEEAAEVPAFHLERVEAEPAGIGTGLPGQEIAARRPPIVSPMGNELDLVVGVEAAPGELDDRVAAIQHEGRAYRIWREVEDFTDLGEDRHVYVADRMTGSIVFAPAVRMPGPDGSLEDAARALAEVPAAGRAIRLWYGRGGGPSGNVAARALTTLLDPIPGARLIVENPAPATGGRAAETLDNALRRGPLELHSLKRAVTARDYELVALRYSGAVERAKAFARSELWAHAAPGTVEVLLVPRVPDAADRRGRIPADLLRERQTEDARAQIQRALDQRRTLGTSCLVTWVRYKTVRVQAHVVVHREEDPKAVEGRVLDRLYETIGPLTSPRRPAGWRFGQTLRDSHIYDIILAEPGVSYAQDVDFFVDEVPDKDVNALAADAYQPRTWYAASGDAVYRTLNDGEGWEPAGRFPDEIVGEVAPHPWKPGLLAASTRPAGDPPRSRVYLSADCGESWRLLRETSFRVEDLAWALRDGVPILFLATGAGLYEIRIRQDQEAEPVQVVVDPANQALGFYAVSTSVDVNGQLQVAAAAQGGRGVFLSSDGGRTDTFRPIGLVNEDVRLLAVQVDGPRSFLWAGVAASGPNDIGKGCFSWELLGSKDPVEKWREFRRGWKGGSCRGLAFQGARVLAATHHAGVLGLDASAREPSWTAPDFVKCRLPLRDEGRLHPVAALAAGPGGRLIMAGGVEGVHRSADAGATYAKCSDREVESVTLPETWLFCSGEHRIVVEREDEKAGH